MFENFNDGYHANRLHHTIQDFCPSNLAAFPVPWDDASNVIFRTNGYIHIDGGFNATTKALHAGVPEAHRGGALALDVRARCRPRCASAPRPTRRSSSSCARRPPTRSTSRSATSFHPTALEHPMFDHLFAMSDAGVQVFVSQDQDATTKVQRGMH